MDVGILIAIVAMVIVIIVGVSDLVSDKIYDSHTKGFRQGQEYEIEKGKESNELDDARMSKALKEMIKMEYQEPSRKNKVISMIHMCMNTGVEIPQAWYYEYNTKISIELSKE